MKYHKQKIRKHSLWITFHGVFALGSLIGLGFLLTEGAEGFGILTFSLIAAVSFGFVFYHARRLSKVRDDYQAVKESGLLKVLENVNPYPTHREILAAALKEKQNKLYDDETITITDNFLKSGTLVLLLDGILDAEAIVSKRNGVVMQMDLTILYYTSEKVTFRYSRPSDFSSPHSVRQCAANLEYAVNLIASKSKLFRKYDCCRL